MAVDNFIDAGRRDVEVSGKLVLAKLQRLEKFFQKNLAGMNGVKPFSCHDFFSVLPPGGNRLGC